MSDPTTPGTDAGTGCSTFKLPARFDTAACEGVAKALTENQHHDLSIDASEVEVLMSQAAMLLLSAKRTWDEEGRSIGYEKTSEAFDTNLQTLGIKLEQLVSEK